MRITICQSVLIVKLVTLSVVQETDPGKFTVAFHSWHAGLVWAACMRQQLALQHYPEDVLGLPELAPKYSEDGTLTSRGVQPQVRCRDKSNEVNGLFNADLESQILGILSDWMLSRKAAAEEAHWYWQGRLLWRHC